MTSNGVCYNHLSFQIKSGNGRITGFCPLIVPEPGAQQVMKLQWGHLPHWRGGLGSRLCLDASHIPGLVWYREATAAGAVATTAAAACGFGPASGEARYCQQLPAHFRSKGTLWGTEAGAVPARGGSGVGRGEEPREWDWGHRSEPCVVPLKWGKEALQAPLFTWKEKWQFASNYEPFKDKQMSMTGAL